MIPNQLTKQKKSSKKIIPHNSEKDDSKMDAFAVWKKARLKMSTVLIGHINVNSIRNKFMVSETKLDSSFTNAQFVIKRYAPPFRYDRNCHGFMVVEDIPAKMLSKTSTKDFEEVFVQLAFRKKKILLCCSYNPHKSDISSYLISLRETLNIQITK